MATAALSNAGAPSFTETPVSGMHCGEGGNNKYGGRNHCVREKISTKSLQLVLSRAKIMTATVKHLCTVVKKQRVVVGKGNSALRSQ